MEDTLRHFSILPTLLLASALMMCGANTAKAYILTAQGAGGPLQCSNGPGCSGSNFDEYFATGLTKVASDGCLFTAIGSVCGDASADLAGFLKVKTNSTGIVGATSTAGFTGPVTLVNPCGSDSVLCQPPVGMMTISLYLNGKEPMTAANAGADLTVDLGVISSALLPSDVTEVTNCQWRSGVLTKGPCADTRHLSLSISVPISFSDPTTLIFAEVQAGSFGLADINFYDTATFGITLPGGVSYVSPMTFLGPEVSAVPEPTSFVLAFTGVVACCTAKRGFASRTKRRLAAVPD